MKVEELIKLLQQIPDKKFEVIIETGKYQWKLLKTVELGPNAVTIK